MAGQDMHSKRQRRASGEEQASTAPPRHPPVLLPPLMLLSLLLQQDSQCLGCVDQQYTKLWPPDVTSPLVGGNLAPNACSQSAGCGPSCHHKAQPCPTRVLQYPNP